MALPKLEAAFRRWCAEPVQSSAVTLLHCDGGEPSALHIQFYEHRVSIFADGVGDDGRAQFFVEGEDDEDDESGAVDDWLVDVNTFLADRPMPLEDALGFMARTFPDKLKRQGEAAAEDAAGGSSGAESEEEASAAGDGDVAFETWCRARQLPPGLETLRQRFLRPLPLELRTGSPVLQEAAAAEAILAESEGGAAVALACLGGLGLVQLAADPVRGLCGERPDLALQLGLDSESPIVLALVLSDAALQTEGWQLQGSIAHISFSQGVGRGGGRGSPHVIDDLVPKVADAFLAWRLGSPGVAPLSPSMEWLADVQASGRLRGNVFLDLWLAISYFTRHCTDYCPICLKRHGLALPSARCCPCREELCVFRYEEYLANVHAEVARDPELVELHLMLAAAAAQEPETFEPFPPQFLRRREVRARAGALGDGEGGEGSTANKDLAAVRAAIAQLPRVGALAATASEQDLRELMGGSSSGAYRFLQFVLGSNRLALERVTREDLRLQPLPSCVAQLAVLSGAPSAERAFAERRRRWGSDFAFHGSRLHKWFSIMRNGLRVLSDTSFMSSGALHGAGVYLARDWSTAVHYCFGFEGSGYACSLGEPLQAVGVVEYALDPDSYRLHGGGIITVSDASALMLRYVLIYSKAGLSSAGSSVGDWLNLGVGDLNVAQQYCRLQEHVRQRSTGDSDLNRSRCDLSFLAFDDRAAL